MNGLKCQTLAGVRMMSQAENSAFAQHFITVLHFTFHIEERGNSDNNIYNIYSINNP